MKGVRVVLGSIVDIVVGAVYDIQCVVYSNERNQRFMAKFWTVQMVISMSGLMVRALYFMI